MKMISPKKYPEILLLILFIALFFLYQRGQQGLVKNHFLRETVLPSATRLSALFTDLKFRIRGAQPSNQKVVVVDIDSNAIDKLGRWPWHRNLTAYLIQRVFDLGAAQVGLDMVFSEPEERIPEELLERLRQKKLEKLADGLETDPVLAKVFEKNADRFVVGWQTESLCQPLLGNCSDAESSPDLEKFALRDKKRTLKNTALPTVVIPTFNLPLFNAATKHQGFVNAMREPDGVVRKAQLLLNLNGKLYPSLPLELARVNRGEEIEATIDNQDQLRALRFLPSQTQIPVSPTGQIGINYRGPKQTIPYVTALEVLSAGQQRGLASASEGGVQQLKGAIAILGVSAQAVGDMAPSPFDDSHPGVEIQATILDNLINGDYLYAGFKNNPGMESLFLILIMAIIGTILVFSVRNFRSLPTLLIFLGILSSIISVDLWLFFQKHQDWHTAFLYCELFSVFAFGIVMKYRTEEKDKQFLRTAFGKYVPETVVAEIVRDPTQLRLGGEKKSVTILFSDIRSFTTFSEKTDAKRLAEFLNEYFTLLTDVVLKHGGTLDKFIGDALMAFFGAPIAFEDHASKACQAALGMLEQISQHREHFNKRYGFPVEMGIGLNSGVVSVGNMGTDRAFDYTVIGDQVNLASRVESVTKQYKTSLLTTHFTLAEIKRSGQAEPFHRVLDRVQVKGKKEPVDLIQLSQTKWDDEVLGYFSEGRESYRNQKWDSAILHFEKANSRFRSLEGSDDGPSKVFIERCLALKEKPPKSEWTGIWSLEK